MAASQPSRLPAARSGKPRPISMYGADVSGAGVEAAVTTKQAKRRSLLPQFTTRKVSDELLIADTIAEDGGRSATDSMTDSAIPEAVRDERRAMPPPPKPNRTTSTRMPGLGPFGRSASVRTHTRSPSKDAHVGLENAASVPRNLASASQQRLDSGVKHLGSTRTPPSPNKQRTVPAISSHTRVGSISTTVPAPADKRSSVHLGRLTPINVSTANGYQFPPQASPTSPASSTTSRQSAPRTQLPPSSRPAFNTFQQHYSPAKSALPKPPLPSVKAVKKASSIDEPEIAMTADVVRDQAELLQLSMLHQLAVQTTGEWEASAKRRLGRKHARLGKYLGEIEAIEGQRRTLDNLAAVEAWCPDAPLLAEHLQLFNKIVSDLRMLNEPGSRYMVLTATFEDWIASAEGLLFGGGRTARAACVLEPLPDSWRATHTSMALKMRSIQREIATLPPAPVGEDGQSSLEIMLELCSSLTDSMLKELEVMTKLQKEVLQQGKARIDEQVSALVQANEQQREMEKENWTPAW